MTARNNLSASRVGGRSGVAQLMPMRITEHQQDELEDVQNAAAQFRWSATYLPGEYGTLRLVCEKGDQVLKASAVPPRVQSEGGGRTQTLCFSYSTKGGKPERIHPREVIAILSGRKTPNNEHYPKKA